MAYKMKRVFTRHYTDNDKRACYVEWTDGSRTEAPAENYHGVLVPVGAHMGALFDRALAQGLTIEREIW